MADHILKEMEENYPWMASSIGQVNSFHASSDVLHVLCLQVLKVVYWSRNGVLLNELLQVSFSFVMCELLLHMYMYFCILYIHTCTCIHMCMYMYVDFVQ